MYLTSESEFDELSSGRAREGSCGNASDASAFRFSFATALVAGIVWSAIECVDLQVSSRMHFALASNLWLFWFTHLSIGVGVCALLLSTSSLVATVVAALARRFARNPDRATSTATTSLLLGFYASVWTAACFTGLFRLSDQVVGIAVGLVLCGVAGLVSRRRPSGRSPAEKRRLDGVLAVDCFVLVLVVHRLNSNLYSKQYFTLHVAATVFALTAAIFGARYALRGTGLFQRQRWSTGMRAAVLCGILAVPVVLFEGSNNVRDALFRGGFDAKAVLYLVQKVPFFRFRGAVARPLAKAQVPAAVAPAHKVVDRVLLITIDALRADHLPMYGYGRDTAPVMRAFADNATTFDWAWSSQSFTTFALSTVFARNGHGPDLAASLGARKMGRSAIISKGIAGIVGQSWVASSFDRVIDLTEEDDFRLAQAAGREIEGGRFTGLMWIHMYAPHAPYKTRFPNPFGDTDIDRYDGEIRESDGAVGQVLAALDRNGLTASTAVIITSDHGEEFGEHGGRSHGWDVYNELIHIPLMIRVPGFARRRVQSHVSHRNLPTTVADLLGMGDAALNEDRWGLSLMPLLAGGEFESDRAVMVGPGSTFGVGALMWQHWKLTYSLFSASYGLYDLTADPREGLNLFEARPEVARRLRDILQSRLQEINKSGQTGG